MAGHSVPNAWASGSPRLAGVGSVACPLAHLPGCKRNVVWLTWDGETRVPDRRLLVSCLKDMGFSPSDLFALIHASGIQEFDVSFMTLLLPDHFWAGWEAASSQQGSRRAGFTAIPIAGILVWARRYGDVKGPPVKILDEDEIWTGGWTDPVLLREIRGVTQLMPNSFFIGVDRVSCFYPGQPQTCHRYRSYRHFSNAGAVQKCTMCGAVGHLQDTCSEIRIIYAEG
ncbi:Hypothetical predicted protein [Pelobates cultripes]|uniref:CCHC-type domain-containing protein n=1 Tax=Pelobates cultripes TaxID=61616 RepID=A0AAD1R609_PELCU|nr:Hypothetical predicted protein [Pelobates cultripes]